MPGPNITHRVSHKLLYCCHTTMPSNDKQTLSNSTQVCEHVNRSLVALPCHILCVPQSVARSVVCTTLLLELSFSEFFSPLGAEMRAQERGEGMGECFSSPHWSSPLCLCRVRTWVYPLPFRMAHTSLDLVHTISGAVACRLFVMVPYYLVCMIESRMEYDKEDRSLNNEQLNVLTYRDALNSFAALTSRYSRERPSEGLHLYVTAFRIFICH